MFKYAVVIFLGIIVLDQSCATQASTKLTQLNNDQDKGLFCNFEEGHNCSFSQFYTEAMMQKWKLYQGNNTSIKTFDHTYHTLSGHFFGIDFASVKTGGVTYDYAILSRKFAPTRGTCVTFSYYMRGMPNNELLKFGIKKDTSSYQTVYWTMEGELGPFWYSHRMTINSTVNWQIYFDIQAFNTSEGLVAIDDVTVEIDRPCPARGKCDFERRNTCMWESIYPTQYSISQQQKLRWSNLSISLSTEVNRMIKTDYIWVVYSPALGFDDLFPKADHTLGLRSGNFLLLNNQSPRKSGDRAVIMSDRYDVSKAQPKLCLSFYYWLFNQAGHSPNTVFEVYQSENYNRVVKIAQISKYNKVPGWINFKITGMLFNTSSTNMWFYLVGTSGDSRNSFFAIDDISVDQGSCHPTPTKTSSTINKPVTLSVQSATTPINQVTKQGRDLFRLNDGT